MRVEVKEGKAKLLVDEEEVISKNLEVFYNKKMAVNRTASIYVLRALEKKNLQIGLPLAGTGVRGIRFLLELQSDNIKELSLNDTNEKAKDYFEENLRLNKISKEDILDKVFFTQEDANLFLLKSKGFDYIDIDPFGSPNFLLHSAISRISRKGILAVSATDTAALSGTYPKTCKQKYWSESALSPQKHEMALRILIRKVQLIGMQNEKALYPIFSYHYEHYYRVFFRVEKGRQKASALFDLNNTFFHYCPHCALTFNDESKIRTCPECQSGLKVAGPLYSGKIHDTDFLKNMKKHLEQNNINNGLGDEREVLRLVDNALRDNSVDMVGSFDTHSLAKKRSFWVDKIEVYLDCLKAKGFVAVQNSLPPTSIKTDASFEEFTNCFRKEDY